MREITEISRIRRKLGLTQKDLASQAGVSQSLIAKVEAGKLDPTFTKAKLIFEALDELREKEELKARDLMNKKICFVRKEDSLKTVIRLMRAKGISQIPVTGREKVVGLISESIILNEILENPGKVASLKAEDVMEEAPPIISAKIRAGVVSQLLRDFPIVLVSEKGDVKGIISKADLLGRI
jgi:predicted transcriptional regulator